MSKLSKVTYPEYDRKRIGFILASSSLGFFPLAFVFLWFLFSIFILHRNKYYPKKKPTNQTELFCILPTFPGQLKYYINHHVTVSQFSYTFIWFPEIYFPIISWSFPWFLIHIRNASLKFLFYLFLCEFYKYRRGIFIVFMSSQKQTHS